MRPIWLWLMIAASVGGARADAASWVVRFVPASGGLPPMETGKPAQVCVLVRNTGASAVGGVLSLRVPATVMVEPLVRPVTLAPGRCEAYCFQLMAARTAPQPFAVQAVMSGRPAASLSVGDRFDLSALEWRARLDSDRKGIELGWARPDFDDSGWQTRHLPFLTNDLGITYIRGRVIVPESWRGKPLHIKLAAVDDNDAAYLNGVEIGRTNGWSQPRDYVVPEKTIRFDEENLICVAVDNIHAGGGIYRSPNTFGPESGEPKPAPPAKLHPAGPIGDAMPFRNMRVEDGVLRYPDGKEVCLFGVNYYPQSWGQYANMKKLTSDMKAAIRRDMDDMKAMGVEVIRVHIFDTEITDRQGNLLENDHLDLLDYAVSEAKKRGIYYMFTLIAWWGSPVQNPDSFSVRTPKEAMWFADEAVAAEENYVRRMLTHRNPYTGLRYCEEPAVCALEIMNEPAYWDYNDMMDDKAEKMSRATPEHAAPFNSDWPQHYLNLVYTPSKAVGFAIAREVFHGLPRGADYPTPPDNQVFGDFAVSFAHNVSLMSTRDTWANAEPVGDWNPLPIPKTPKRIIGVGSSPFVAYDGSGSYEITVGSRSAELLIRPDVVYVRDPLASDAAVGKTAAELRDQARPFTVKYPGVEIKKVTRVDTGASVAAQDNTFEVSPGTYRVEW